MVARLRSGLGEEMLPRLCLPVCETSTEDFERLDVGMVGVRGELGVPPRDREYGEEAR